MLGRVLFALVCAVIAAGVALPLYPSDLGARRSKAADPVLLAADSVTAACGDVRSADHGRADLCGRLLLATFVAVDDGSSLSVILLIRPQPASERQTLPPKLPTI